jgi:hypothetical protein
MSNGRGPHILILFECGTPDRTLHVGMWYDSPECSIFEKKEGCLNKNDILPQTFTGGMSYALSIIWENRSPCIWALSVHDDLWSRVGLGSG